MYKYQFSNYDKSQQQKPSVRHKNYIYIFGLPDEYVLHDALHKIPKCISARSKEW